jgi:hypothetical protein
MSYPTQLLVAIWVSLWSGVAAGSQASDGVLSGALRAHIQNERFEIVTSIRGLPLGVRDELQTLFGSGLDIADPGAEFQRTGGGSNPKLPLRRLAAAGCSVDFHCLVYYERGGREPTWHVMLFHWTPSTTRFEWGAMAPGGLATIDDVRTAMLSGRTTGPAKFW